MNIYMESSSKRYISSEVRFYTVDDIMSLTGWGKKKVLTLFKDPEFPSAIYGKKMIVEAHALIDFFSVKRGKEGNDHWTRGELSNELKKRIG